MAAPTLASINSDTGSSGTDLITNDQSLILAGTADANSFVEIFVNGESVGFGQADGSGNWSIDLASQYGSLAEGTHAIQILSTLGMSSTFSTTYSLTVDVTAPAAPSITGITDDTGASASDGITTDNTLTLTGTAEANAVVHIFDFGTEIGTAQADGSGAWTYNTGSLGGDQAYSFSVSQTDVAGNTGATSGAHAIFIDDTVAAPVIGGIADDTGSSGSDGTTSDSTITLSGTGEAGAVVTVTEGVTALGTALVDGSGNWSFTPGALADGDYTFTATQTDVAGNVSSASSDFDVTVDTASPAAPVITAFDSDTGASSSDGVTSDNTVTVTGTAEANSIVRVLVGGIFNGSTLADGSGDWSYTTSALADGTSIIMAVSLDAAGNGSGNSNQISVTVDTAAPAAPVLTGVTTDSGLSGTDEITNDDTPTIGGTAEAGATIEIFRDTVSVGTVTADGSGNWSYTDTSLTDGTYSYTAEATDTAGNTSATSSALSVTVDTADPAAPAITAFSDDSGDTGDGITNETIITLQGTAEAGSIVSVFDGATLVRTTTADGTGAWTAVTGTLAEGTHTFSATATDTAGNEGVASADFSVEIDTIAPTAAVTSINNPGAGSFDTGASSTDEVTRDRTLILSGTASEPGASIVIFHDGSPVGTATADGSGNWSFNYTGTVLADGTYDFTAQATDVAGNTGAESSVLSVVIDNVAPAVATATGISTDSGSSSSDGVTNDTTVVINGTAEAGATVEVFVDNVSVGTTTADGSGNWSFDHTATTLAEGEYEVLARVTDTAGNSRIGTTPFTFTVDTTAPNTPAITSFSEDTAYIVPSGFPDLGTSFSDGVTKDNTITLNGTGDIGAIITVLDGATELGTALVDGSGNWTYTTAALADGNHSFTATASDVAGNESAASGATAVTIDTVNPTAPVITGITTDTGSSSTDGITSDTTFTVHGTGEAGTAIWLSSFQVPPGYNIIGGGAGTALVDVNGDWSIDLSALEVLTSTSPFHAPYVFTDGSYGFFAEALDDAGNGSGFGSTFTVTIDTTAPFAPTIASFSTDSGATGDFITNDTTITLTGTGLANAVLTVQDGGTPIGTTLTDANGDWSFTTGVLSDASHSFTAFSTDTAGNIGATSAAMVIVVDATAPAAPAIDATITTDTGSSATDRITSDTTITLTGTAEADSTVFIGAGATLFGSAAVDGSGNWSFTIPGGALTDGTYEFAVSARDAAGNFSPNSAGLSVTIDTAGPAAPVVTGIATDTGTSATDEITSDGTLVINGTAEANSVVTVTQVGLGVLGTALTDGSGNWSFDHTGTTLTDGAYSFTATATDVAGNTGSASSALSVTVDSGAPAAPTIDATVTTDTGSSATDGITSDTTLVLTGTAEANSIVTVTDGVTDIGTAAADGSGNWSFTTGTLAEGGHSFTATATDAAGNEGAASAALAVTVDTTAPAAPTIDATITTDTGSSATDRITSDTTVTLTGTAEANSTVFIGAGATLFGNAAVDGSGNWSFTIPGGALTDGIYGFVAAARDAAGNFSPNSAELSVTVDTAIATPVISGFADDTGSSATDGITSDNSPTISGTGEAGATIQLLRGGNPLATTTVDGSGNWSYTDTSGLADGTHLYTAIATDAAGNVSSTSATLTVTVDRTNPATPTDSNAGTNTVSEGAVNGATVGVTASATDATGVQYSLTDDAGGRFTIDANTGVVSVADASLLNFESATSHNVTVQATDLAGNTSTQTFAIDVTNVAPSAPVDNNGAAGGNVADDAVNGTAVGITALSSDVHGGTVTYSLTDSAGGRFAIDANTGVVTVADASLIDASVDLSHTITVQATDGNLTSTTTDFTITVGNIIVGTAGKDIINGTVSAPGQAVTTNGVDIIDGSGGDDTISALGGDDQIDGGAGKDKMDGGAGNDTYIVDNASDKITELVGGGNDSVEASVSYKLASNVENLTLTGTAAINATGSNDANVLIGNSGANIIKGNGGDDRIEGAGGNDALDGGIGNDTFVFQGVFGNDTIKGFAGNGAAAGDTIEFDSAIFADFAAVQAAITDTGKDLVITHANGTITLLKVADVSLLDASDFTFV